MLKAMSAYVSGQETIELTLDSDIEVVAPALEKTQFTSSGEVLLSRPGKLRAHRTSGHNDATMTFDGKTVSIVSRSLEGYAQFETPGTLDRLFDVLWAGYGVALPAADLLKTNSCELLVAGVLEAKHIGRGVVGGVLCEHLAFRNVDTDGQLWVEAGEKPIPRKLVITSKTMNSAPQYTVVVKSWKTGVTPAPGAFAFVPGPNAKEHLLHAAVRLHGGLRPRPHRRLPRRRAEPLGQRRGHAGGRPGVRARHRAAARRAGGRRDRDAGRRGQGEGADGRGPEQGRVRLPQLGEGTHRRRPGRPASRTDGRARRAEEGGRREGRRPGEPPPAPRSARSRAIPGMGPRSAPRAAR